MNSQSIAVFLASTTGAIVLFLLILWSLAWKGIALWQAARREAKGWYVVLLILNTLGILEIIYIFLIAKNQE
ncbi:MAG: DUF5652 family protein [Candidatus Parcubacteria bacterium]|nr:DUF5652 family protein [Candidatus Parcubacteria bacterium]